MSIDYAELRRLAIKGRRAESRAVALQGCFGAILGILANMAWHGWVFMIAVGALHGGWLHQVPTIGYATSVFFVFGVRAAVYGMFHRRSVKES